MTKEVGEQEIEEEEVTPAEEEEEIEIKPPSEEEEDTGEAQEKEPEQKEDSYEKRYKDLQSHADKREARYKKLLAPFEKNIVEDENGDLSFKFDDTSQKKEEDIPEPATQEDWDLDPRAAEEKQYKFRRYQEKQEEAKKANQEKQLKDAEEANKNYVKARADIWSKTQELYPDVKDKESDLFKKAQEILESDPSMTASPRCDLLAVKEAAMELGVTPQGKRPVKKKATYIIGGSSGSGGNGGGKELSDEEFGKLSPDEQSEYMKKQYFRE